MTATTALAAAVDASVATKPLRLAVLAGREPAIVGAVRAVALRSFVEIVLAMTTARHPSFLERAAAIREARPDVILFAGDRGDADDLVDFAEAMRLACDGWVSAPLLLVAADERTEARIERSAGRSVERAGDPRSDAGRSAIVARLRELRYASGSTQHDEAVEKLARTSAEQGARTTLVVDVRSAMTSVALARADGSVVAAHAPIGVGAAADRVVERGGLERVRRWIPRSIDASALLERIFNRTLSPDVAPASPLALAIEMALARECIARVLADAERCGIALGAAHQAPAVVCSGRLAAWPRPQQTVLVAVDALAPTGMAVVSGGETPLAFVVPLTPRRPMTVRVTDGTGATDESAAKGAFLTIPTTGAIEVTVGGTSSRGTADPVAVGVVVDARGRPLELPARDAERVPTLARWIGALSALPPESEW